MPSKPKSDPGPRVIVENIHTPGRTVSLDAGKYNAMLNALLQVLPAQPPGLTQAEMLAAILPHLPEDLFPGGAKAGWWMKSVQLDQEAKGGILREKVKPLRWHRR